jgi:toxin CcdB
MEKFLMPRFDVYPNPEGRSQNVPYLIDVQSDLLSDLDSRVVIPLRSLSSFAAVKLPSRLIPTLTVLGDPFLLETPKMAAVPSRVLREPVASLQAENAIITAALDFLFQGY